MLPVQRGVTVMGKVLAAWLLVATAMAATPSPRDVVQTAVTRVIAVLQNDFEAAHLDRELRWRVSHGKPLTDRAAQLLGDLSRLLVDRLSGGGLGMDDQRLLRREGTHEISV